MGFSSPARLPVEVLLREEQIASDFADALTHHFLEEKFFYWLPHSVKAWTDLCGNGECLDAIRSVAVLACSAPALARLWPAADALCGLGCGEGSKERLLLDAFAECGRRLFYSAADSSQSLLEMALTCAAPAANRLRGIKLDLLSDDHLALLAASVGGRACIYSVLGNTLAALGPDDFPARLRNIMRPDDRALFDGELYVAGETSRSYDHPATRRFAFAPLAALGVSESDGELCFEWCERDDGLHQVAKHFLPARDLTLNVAGRPVHLAKGEKLRMPSSIKYDEAAFFDRLVQGGFRVEFSQKTEDGRLLLAACAPR